VTETIKPVHLLGNIVITLLNSKWTVTKAVSLKIQFYSILARVILTVVPIQFSFHVIFDITIRN